MTELETASLPSGYELVTGFLSSADCRVICEELDQYKLPVGTGGIRNAEKKFEAIYQLAHADKLQKVVKHYLTGKAQLVRAIVFNKTSYNNWLVSWHQDKTVSISARIDEPEWGPWSKKDGTLHVQAPLAVLNNMITVRIHLDPANANNGCLKVIPESHQQGLLSHIDIQRIVQLKRTVLCESAVGDALVMRPHLLHASSKSQNPSQRRVLHLEYSGYSLPKGINWA